MDDVVRKSPLPQEVVSQFRVVIFVVESMLSIFTLSSLNEICWAMTLTDFVAAQYLGCLQRLFGEAEPHPTGDSGYRGARSNHRIA